MTQAAGPAAGGPRLRGLAIAFLRRFLVQVGPGLVFLGVFAWRGIAAGTMAFIVASLGSVTITFIRHRSLPTMPMVTAVLVACFGGLTLVYDEATYIQIQATVTNGLYAAILGGARLSGHDLLERAFGSVLQLDRDGWRVLTRRLVLYLLVLAVANELVRRGFPVGTWLTFKTLVVGGLDMAFAIAQVPLIRARWAGACGGGAGGNPGTDSRAIG